MRSFLKLLVLVPLALLLVAFAVANRQAVTVSFDPLSPDVPAFALSGPLYLVIMLVVIGGVIIGGVASWLAQGRHRRAARAGRRDTQELQAEIDRLKTELQIETRRADQRAYTALPGQTAA